MTEHIAAIVAHPDDEVLGCGGALALHAAAGDKVRILILATGLAARGAVGSSDFEALRRQAENAAKVLGAQSVAFGEFPDNAMDSVPLLEVVQRVEGFLDEFPADTIYTHHAGDLNIDHRLTQGAVMTACRPLPGAAARKIFACEVNSSTEWAAPSQPPFVPTEFVDINAVLETKVRALACYENEIRDWPHPRSEDGVRALARWRGGQCGVEAAESFVTLRRVRGHP